MNDTIYISYSQNVDTTNIPRYNMEALVEIGLFLKY